MNKDTDLSAVGRRLYMLSVAILAVTLLVWGVNYPSAPTGTPPRIGQTPFAALEQTEAFARAEYRNQYFRCLFSDRAGSHIFSVRCPVEGNLYLGSIAGILLGITGFVVSGLGRRSTDD